MSLRIRLIVLGAAVGVLLVIALFSESILSLGNSGCPHEAQGDLITNGDFSNGTSGWQLFPPAPQVSPIPSCQGYAAHLTNGSGINGVVGNKGLYFSSKNCTFPVASGLEFSIWSKVSAQTNLSVGLTFIGSYSNGTGVQHKWFIDYLLSWHGPFPTNFTYGTLAYRSILVNSSTSSWKEQIFDVYSNFKGVFGDPALFCVTRVSAGDVGGESFITDIALVRQSQ